MWPCYALSRRSVFLPVGGVMVISFHFKWEGVIESFFQSEIQIANGWSDQDGFRGAIIRRGLAGVRPTGSGQVSLLLQHKARARGRPGNSHSVGSGAGHSEKRSLWGLNSGGDSPESAVQSEVAAAHLAGVRLADGA